MKKCGYKEKRVVITGIGPICSLGLGCDEVWKSVLKKHLNLANVEYSVGDEKWGKFYVHKMRDFDIETFGLPKEGLKFIKELRTVKKEDTDLYYFLGVIKLALKDSGLKYDPDSNNIGLVISHENPGIEIFFEELVDSVYDIFKNVKDASRLELAKGIYKDGCEDRGYNLQTFSYLFCAAKVFDFHGYSLFINNACASGLFAVESAAHQIKAGVSPVVITAAVDNPTKIYKYLWFKKKGLYAEDGIYKPFCRDAKGVVFGDGGAALVLEDLEHARKRGARIYAEYLGGGFSLEGWKITVPNIANDFYTRSFNKALQVSGIKPDRIDFINPHGVGLNVTDTYEARTINSVFRRRRPPISAFKPLVGHNLGGSALLESAIALLAMKHDTIPATLNCENINEKLELNIVKKNTSSNLNIIAKMSCGFAGFNGVILLRKMCEVAR